ncbi:MAG: hypothetical protein F6K58_01495 [Symploca sp. SIO2E9]|nr:hypothetical protein [Symploca sp. SIO2E9]
MSEKRCGEIIKQTRRGGDAETGRCGDAENSNPTQDFVHPKRKISRFNKSLLYSSTIVDVAAETRAIAFYLRMAIALIYE